MNVLRKVNDRLTDPDSSALPAVIFTWMLVCAAVAIALFSNDRPELGAFWAVLFVVSFVSWLRSSR